MHQAQPNEPPDCSQAFAVAEGLKTRKRCEAPQFLNEDVTKVQFYRFPLASPHEEHSEKHLRLLLLTSLQIDTFFIKGQH